MRQGKYFPQKCRLEASDGIFYAVSAAARGLKRNTSAALARSPIKEGGTQYTGHILGGYVFNV
ncbi:hypothetical protein [Neisseria cinerea]|uniref:hypothetical protein n=1 Tax=Neisseria cinerea TaxID=483 RepID=UPI0027E11315|nr:hypothetical protein [Neisseria cinerea]